MQHEAARPKGRSYDDEPSQQPMRPVLRGQIARNPSTDQKRARRANMRKSADFNEQGAAWTPGHVTCSSCGYQGHPRLGDTGPECGACGSYSVSKPSRPTGPDNSRYLAARSGTDPLSTSECTSYKTNPTFCNWHQTDHLEPDGEPRRDIDGHGNPMSGHTLDVPRCDLCGGMHDSLHHYDETENVGRDIFGNDIRHQSSKVAAKGDPCYHPRSCPACDRAGAPCGGHVAGEKPGHENCSGRAKTATILDTRAEMLNPGDQIKTPNGRTQKVTRVRPHETSAKHVYVDTDGGTALVERGAGFQVAPKNSQQQSLPGYGTPGGNSNTLPFDPQAGGSNAAPSSKCPNCGGSGTLMRKGDHYVCSRCGYTEQFGGAGGATFSDASSVVRTFSTVNAPFKTAVARRAAALLATTKENHS